jgi:hypothetical protein
MMKASFEKVLTQLLLAAVVFVTGALVSCSEDDPASPPADGNPQELITTFLLSLADTNGVAVNTGATFRDLDGPGGADPTIDTLNVMAGAVYHATIVLLDESKTPPDSISNEVAEENLAHRFWFTVGGGAAGRVVVTNADEDEGNPPLPIGLETHISISSGGTASGTLQVVLKHYEQESEKRADSDGTLGESDIDVTFPVEIEN